MRTLFAGMLLAATLRAEPLTLEYYDQDFEVELASPAAAARASLEALPLWQGKAEAFSSRWDDNHLDHLRVKEVMDRHGIKGTFFLNAAAGYTAPSEDGVQFTGDTARDLAKALVQGGHSIGDHTLNHEFTPYLNRNRQFYEILGLRVEREENSLNPISTFAFPFMSHRNDLEGEQSQKDYALMLARAGLIHHSEHPFEHALPTALPIGVRAKAPTRHQPVQVPDLSASCRGGGGRDGSGRREADAGG